MLMINIWQIGNVQNSNISFCSDDNQAVDRAYRMGQTKDVIVYQLVTCAAIEEHTYREQVKFFFLTYFDKQKTKLTCFLDSNLLCCTTHIIWIQYFKNINKLLLLHDKLDFPLTKWISQYSIQSILLLVCERKNALSKCVYIFVSQSNLGSNSTHFHL